MKEFVIAKNNGNNHLLFLFYINMINLFLQITLSLLKLCNDIHLILNDSRNSFQSIYNICVIQDFMECGKLHKVLKERVLPCCMCTSNIEINSQILNKHNITYIQCT